MGARILVTGVAGVQGARVAASLAACDRVERVVGGTLGLPTAAGSLTELEAIVVRGSAAIHGAEPAAPTFWREEDLSPGANRERRRTRFQRDVAEIEQLVAVFARRHPDVACTTLRMQPVVGGALDSPISRLVRAPLVPTYLGFDPRIQVIHLDDATRVIASAAPDRAPGAADRRPALRTARGPGRAGRRPAEPDRRHGSLPPLRPGRGSRATGARARPRPRARHARRTRGHRGCAAGPRGGGIGPDAGLLPWDAAMLTTAICRAWSAGGEPGLRRPRFLVGDDAFDPPRLGVGVRRLGGVPAGPANAARLLGEGHTVLAYPEGATEPRADRNRLLRFGRGGFAASAIRAGVPILPCGIVGGEEAYPRLGQAPGLARLTRLPAFPLTPTIPLLGALGLDPLPSTWRIAVGEPVPTAELGPGAAEDRAVVLALAEAVRTQVQDLVHEQLTQRAGAFL